MKRIVFLVVAALILGVAQARAQQPTFAQVCPNGCSGAPVFGNAQWGFDAPTVSNPGIWVNIGQVWTLVSGGSGSGANPSFTSVTITGTTTALKIANDGLVVAPLGTGTKPTVTTCGTGSASASSTDFAGDVTATGATACTVVFFQPYANKPVCVVTDETTAAGLKIVFNTTLSFTVSGLTSGDEFTYICVGK